MAGSDNRDPADAGNRTEDYGRALKSATGMLSRRQHAVRELKTKLLARFDRETVAGVIGRLGQLGYLDDEAFAREYARQRFSRSPRSALAVTTELEARGVDRTVAQLAVATVLDDGGFTDESLAERAARKKLAAIGSSTGGKVKTRIYSFLSSRGFSREVSRRVVLDVLKQ